MATVKPVKPAAVPQIYTPVPQRSDRANFAERADKTLTSIPGMVDGFNLNLNYVAQAVDYMDEKNTSITQMWTDVNSAKTTVLDALSAIQSGPVSSVNGRSGIVTGLSETGSKAMAEAAYMSDAPLGQWATFPGTSSAGADWPSAVFPSYWNVFTFGSGTRRTQIAWQVFAGAEQSSMFIRSLHDSTWSPWQRFFGDISLMEKSKYVSAPGSAYTANPREATLQYIDISAPLTITLAASRKPGDQITLMFSFPSVSSVAFSSNVKAPVGGIRAGVASHILTVTLVARQDGNWQAYDGGLHPW